MTLFSPRCEYTEVFPCVCVMMPVLVDVCMHHGVSERQYLPLFLSFLFSPLPFSPFILEAFQLLCAHLCTSAWSSGFSTFVPQSCFSRFSLSVNISPIRRCCGNIGDTGLEDVKHCDALRDVSGKFTFKQKPSVFLILARSAHGLVRIQRLLLVKWLIA